MKQVDLALALRDIADEEGRLTAHAVVLAAADPEHPLHGEFTWDDTEAARKYRLDQARQLIKRVTVVVDIEDVGTVKTVGYIRDPSKGPREAGYRAVAAIVHDPDARQEAAVSELSAALNSLKRARILCTVLGYGGPEVESLIDQATSVRTIIAEAPETPQ